MSPTTSWPGTRGYSDAGKSAGDGEHVAVTDAARLHFDAHLARCWSGTVALDELELGIGLGDLNGFHTLHGNLL